MSENPYQAPIVGSGRLDKRSKRERLTRGNGKVAYREFRGTSFAVHFSGESYRDAVRQRVQRAINEEIGFDRVISIQEHMELFGRLTIVVWYWIRIEDENDEWVE